MQKSLSKDSLQSVLSASTTLEFPTDVLLQNGLLGRSENKPLYPPDRGKLKLGDSETSYVQSAHWEAILAGIKGVREDLATDLDIPNGPLLLYGANRQATREEILAAIPPRPVADRLLSDHFNSLEIIPC